MEFLDPQSARLLFRRISAPSSPHPSAAASPIRTNAALFDDYLLDLAICENTVAMWNLDFDNDNEERDLDIWNWETGEQVWVCMLETSLA